MPDGQTGAQIENMDASQHLVDTDLQKKNALDVYKTDPFSMDNFKEKLSTEGINTPEELLKRSSTGENLLGSGGNANVFKIPGIEGYVLRVPNGRFGADTSLQDLSPVEDKFPDLNLGQPVASLGGNTILKEQLGSPAGVPYGAVRQSKSEGPLVYKQSLELAALMPQSAYDSLAELFNFLNQNRLNFDPSKANNILIDKSNERFNVVDISEVTGEDEARNNISYMLIPLMDNAYAWKVSDPEENIHLTDLRKIILLKSIEASKKVGLPSPLPNDSSLQYSFKLAGMENDLSDHVTSLESTTQ